MMGTEHRVRVPHASNRALTLSFAAALVFVGLNSDRIVAAPQKKLWPFGKKPVQYEKYESASPTFIIDYPRDEWHIVPRVGSVLVTFAQQKSEAAVSLEREAHEDALDSKDLTETSANLETTQLQLQTPGATDFKAAIREENGKRLIVVDFTRPGVKQGVERAREYVIVAGKETYRITCSAPSTMFDKYEPIFQHMVGSFDLHPNKSAPPKD